MTEEQLKRLGVTYRHDVPETSIIFCPTFPRPDLDILAPPFSFFLISPAGRNRSTFIVAIDVQRDDF